MSEEEENSNEDSNEKEENEEEENDEEKEDDENEDDDNEEKEEEEDDEGEEKEEEEDEGEENEDDEEDDKKDNKKKKKAKGKDKNKKEKEKNKEKLEKGKINPTKEAKIDFKQEQKTSLKSNLSNGVEAIIPKKTTIQVLMEISTEMDTLSSHMEKTLPIKPVTNYTNNFGNNINNNIINNSYSIIANLDKEDLEIKNLINKANELSKNSINSNKNKEEIKTFEDKCCQSDDEIINDYNNNKNDINENEDKSKEEFNNDKNGNRYPYDPYRHLDYYNDLKNNNRNNNLNNNINNNINDKENNVSFSYTRVKKMEDLYTRTNNNSRRQPMIYTQPESINNNNTIRNNSNININQNQSRRNWENNSYNNIERKSFEEQKDGNDNNVNNFENNNIYFNKKEDNNYERFRPSSITQAMDILLEKNN